MEPLSLFCHLLGPGQSAQYARAFGEHFLASNTTGRPLVVAVLGETNVGKSLMCRYALTPLIGEENAVRITRPSSKPCRTIYFAGGLYRRSDSGYKAHREITGSAGDWPLFLSGTGGMIPRAPEGDPGVDWVEHPTLPHLVRADFILTLAMNPKNNTPQSHPEHMIATLKDTLNTLPQESIPPALARRRLLEWWGSGPKVEQYPGWDLEKKSYVRRIIIPQLSKSGVLAQGKPGRVVGLTIPSLPESHPNVEGFRGAIRHFEMST